MKLASCALALAVFLLFARPAAAFCGFYVGGADTKSPGLFAKATQVVLLRDGTRTVLTMENAYDGPPESFAMVVPVPVVLQKDAVKTLPREAFAKIDALDAPRLVEYWEQDPCAPVTPQTPFPKRLSAPAFKAKSEGAANEDLGVTVEAQYTVGEYEIVILSAKDSGGLETWLTQNHYKIPEGAEPYLRPYVQGGSKFFVARVDPKKVKFEGTTALLSPLRFHYDSEKFELPVRLGLVSSNGTQDLVVHILAKGQRYEVANYPNVTIPTNLDVAESARSEFGTFYTSLFDRTIEKNPKAVVTEYAWDASTCDPCPGPALGPQDLATFGVDVIQELDERAQRATSTGDEAKAAADAGSPLPAGKAPPSCTPPYTIDSSGIKHFKSECLTGRALGIPRPRRSVYAGWTVTRLHARYSKESLGEDLVFAAAKPLLGGREIRKDGGGLEHGATVQDWGANNFQARYAIRHPWAGEIACKNPVRGLWGGPPRAAGAPPAPTREPTAVKNVGLVPRAEKPAALASFVRGDIAELGVKGELPPLPTYGASADPAADAAAADATGAEPVESPSKRGCGCGMLGSRGVEGRFSLTVPALGVVALALLRRRKAAS